MPGTAVPLESEDFLGTLDAAVRLTPAFRLGITDIDVTPFRDQIPGGREHPMEHVRLVLNEGKRRFPQAEVASSDAWIGPRLHAALRLSRREAAIRGVWRFAGLWAADYVRWRFGPAAGVEDVDQAAKAERFIGPDSKQALARLWWMAELFRNGKDYSSAVLALTNQDIINQLFRARLAHHRPTALAAAEVLQGSGGREASALSKAANAAASTLVFDVIATDPILDLASRETWESDRANYDPVTCFGDLPQGPDDGDVPREAIDRMKALLAELLAEAPIRGRA